MTSICQLSFRGFAMACLIIFSGVGNDGDVAKKQRPDDFKSTINSPLNPQQVSTGWLSLFDGESFYGWRNHDGWTANEGVILAEDDCDSILRTGVQFDDFELRFEFQATGNNESRLLIRTSPDPVENDALRIPLNAIEPVKEKWHKMKVVADGQVLEAWINGSLQKKVDSVDLGKGYIGFEHRQGSVRIRNIQLLPLQMKPIFNGKDLSGWDDSKKLASKFEVVEGRLEMKSGWGQLETDQLFGDFVFSIHARTNAKALNSGIFFRCIPDEVMNGYESQISNACKDNDRKQPVDCGTGGIFRRQNARLVNADDQSWFAKTIVADGATLFVWVNGSLVCDWTDRRKPHDNPRKGQRLKPGTIILQGHDPTTDVSFKKIEARELRPRRK